MKNKFKQFSNLCNENKGLIELCILVVAVIGIIPFNQIDFSFATTFFAKVVILFKYNVQIPLYLLLFVLIVVVTYTIRIRKRYTEHRITKAFMVGTWKNEWGTAPPKMGKEIFTYTADGKYQINGVTKFTLEDFSYDTDKKEITFIKTGVPPADIRKALNKLKVIDNDTLVGTEGDGYIKYTRITT